MNNYDFCLSYDLKLIGNNKGIKPNHYYTLCFSRSSLATLMYPHWIASIKGVRPHLSLQSGSYWHLGPEPKITELRKATASDPMNSWLFTTCSRWPALQMICENPEHSPSFHPSQYQNLALQQCVNFPQWICSSCNLCHPALWTGSSPASPARSPTVIPRPS